MRTIVYLFVSLIFVLCNLTAYADYERIPLNLVYYQYSVQQWAKTDTAKVNLNVDVSVAGKAVTQAKQTVMTKLKKISADKPWHIENFQLNVDNTGLVKLHWNVSARLPQALVIQLRQTIRSLSSPGQKFTIGSIVFQPSLAETAEVKKRLREKIYSQANEEVKRLNKLYPKQHYFVHAIYFGRSFGLAYKSGQAAAGSIMMLRQAPPMPRAVNGMQGGRQVTVTAHIVLGSVIKTKHHD